MLNLQIRGWGRRAALLLGGVAVSLGLAGATAARADTLRFLSEVQFPTGFTFHGTQVGGLSGIDYDKRQGFFYAISDDRSQINPARFYKLTIDLSDGTLDSGDVAFREVTTILDKNGQPFAAGSLDPESIRFDPTRKSLFWTSEGDASALVAPFVREMSRDGAFVQELETPAKYDPTADSSSGIRNNLAFESLTLLKGNQLMTATENALFQDGPAASTTSGSPVRVLKLSPRSGQALQEYIYMTEPVTDAPNPAGSFATNGLVEILALDKQRFLALERSFSTGVGNRIRIFLADLAGATNVRARSTIAHAPHLKTVTKELVLDLATLGITLDNIEGMTFGPKLKTTGERTLILISDNNFAASQFTQILAFAIEDGALE